MIMCQSLLTCMIVYFSALEPKQQKKQITQALDNLITILPFNKVVIRKYRNYIMRLSSVLKNDFKQKKVHLKKGHKEVKQWENDLKRKEFDYLIKHNEIKSEYHNKQYKYACDLAFEQPPPQGKYLSLYYEDQLTSVNKMFKFLIIRNQLSLQVTRKYFERGRKVLSEFYQLFIKEESITSKLNSVNMQMNSKITRFLIVTICFLTKAAFVKSSQLKIDEAKILYEMGFEISKNIMTSSTSNYKILKEVSDCILCFSAFLIDTKQIDRALQILFDVLKNQTNITTILSYRLKGKQKSEVKHIKGKLYNRLYAALFNLAQCYQIKRMLHHSYFFLRESELISNLKTETSQKQIKMHLGSIIESYRQFYLQYREIDIIVSSYFKKNQIISETRETRTKPFTNHVEDNNLISQQLVLSNSGTIKQMVKTKRKLYRRSISLQQKLNQQNNKKLMKQYGQEILFFGVNLFDKQRLKTKGTVRDLKQRECNLDENNELSRAYLGTQLTNKALNKVFEDNKNQTKLKKKVKAVKNTEYRTVKQPIQYAALQNKFQTMWKQESLNANKTKQKIYLLRYKSQYLNYKEIAKENKHLFEEIKLCTNKQSTYKDPPRPSNKKESQSQVGINLFKKILLKHAKTLEIKKSETIYILKKKTHFTVDKKQDKQSYSAAEESINFLMQKLKKKKDSLVPQSNLNRYSDYYEYSKVQGDKSKLNVSTTFLTKNKTEMPSLFLSYFTSTTLYVQFLWVLFQYGIKLSKNKQ